MGLPDARSWPARPPCHLREDQTLRHHVLRAWPGDPWVGKFSLSPVHPALLPRPKMTPPPTQPPCQSYRQRRPTPGPRCKAGGGPGTLPPPGSALHTRAPGIWLAARSQRLVGGGAQCGEAGRVCSRHLRRALVKGHSLPGASHHQHPGMTRNELKPAVGGRATGPAVSHSPAANPPPPPLTLSHRAQGQRCSCKTPRTGGTQRRTQKAPGREEHGCPSTRPEATATPTVGPQTTC